MRSVVIFSSTHKWIWYRNVSNLSEKVLRSLFLVRKSCVNTSKEQSVLLLLWANLEQTKHCFGCGSSIMRSAAFFVLYWVQLFICKQRARHLSLCCANWSRTLSTLIFSPLWMCSIADDERWSSVIVFCSGVFNLFIELKLRSAAHADTRASLLLHRFLGRMQRHLHLDEFSFFFRTWLLLRCAEMTFRPVLHEASQPGWSVDGWCDKPWETGASLILYSHWLNKPGWPGKRDYMEKSQPG